MWANEKQLIYLHIFRIPIPQANFTVFQTGPKIFFSDNFFLRCGQIKLCGGQMWANKNQYNYFKIFNIPGFSRPTSRKKKFLV